eukprot:TRINITY_DN2758_c0_g1_i1.p1 TRINITY_DN2758_c0_g1~~TRINITY_DN2758_c0_g1_i1.p1  ORF type:complete len:161 (-),score=13.13 TRINITY_DN2758_c0_g1_i1:211-672(-)
MDPETIEEVSIRELLRQNAGLIWVGFGLLLFAVLFVWPKLQKNVQVKKKFETSQSFNEVEIEEGRRISILRRQQELEEQAKIIAAERAKAPPPILQSTEAIRKPKQKSLEDLGLQAPLPHGRPFLPKKQHNPLDGFGGGSRFTSSRSSKKSGG